MVRYMKYLLAISVVPSLAWADELPYGSANLPHLAADATLVGECVDAEPAAMPEGSEAALFTVRIARVLKGGPLEDPEILVLVPLSLGPPTADRFAGSLAFLRGPLDSTDLSFWGLPEGGAPVFRLVSGEAALIELKVGRREVIEDYLTLGDAPPGQDPGVNWAKRQIESQPQDPFIQNSILHELERHPDDPRALKFLGWATRLEWMKLVNRKLAIDILSRNGSNSALERLKQTAADHRIRFDIRMAVVEEFAEDPDRLKVLGHWTRAKDSLLAAEAKRVLKEISGIH